MPKRTRRLAPAPPVPTPTPAELRQKILDDFQALRIPLQPEQLDAVVARAEREGMSHLEFLRALISEQADRRRERGIAHRIREARLPQTRTLADFDWQFNAAAIDRVRIETLAKGAFIGRRENLVMVGQSGVGKSHIIQAIGQRACVLGYRVRYTTSGEVLRAPDGRAGGPDLAAAAPRIRGFRPLDPRRVRLRPRGARRGRSGGELALQADQRAKPAALDGAGDEHRLRGVGRVPE